MFDLYRHFIEHTAEFEAPLQEVLSKPFLKGADSIPWTPTLEESFKRCRERIASATMLHHPRVRAPLGLFADVSGVAVGACLQKFVDGAWQPLVFLSKKFLTHEEG